MFKISSFFRKKKLQAKLKLGEKIQLVVGKNVAVFNYKNPRKPQQLFHGVVTSMDVLTTIGSNREYFFFKVQKNSLPDHDVKTGSVVGITKDSLTFLNYEKL